MLVLIEVTRWRYVIHSVRVPFRRLQLYQNRCSLTARRQTPSNKTSHYFGLRFAKVCLPDVPRESSCPTRQANDVLLPFASERRPDVIRTRFVHERTYVKIVSMQPCRMRQSD